MPATDTGRVSVTSGPLTITAYPGDNMVLIAMSLADNAIDEQSKNLAGFAIFSQADGKAEQPLLNRLNFSHQITKDTTPEQSEWTSTDEAPFQKFRWVDVPKDGFDADITYRVVGKYFTGSGTKLTDGATARVTVSPPQQAHRNFRVAFTRGYASSQAYADLFHNADIRPKQKSADFDTKPYQSQYDWLGGDAHKQLFDFIAEIDGDIDDSRIDVFAYDLDEPDAIRAFCRWGKKGRLRAILDNASLHTKAGAVEITAAKMIAAAAGSQNVKQGHFNRYQHNKVIIKRDASGKAEKVLFGSMNFSLRGLYIQANNVMITDDATTAGYFAAAFDEAWNDNVKAAAFAASDIAQKYNPISAASTPALPSAAVALSPHSDYSISLGPAIADIKAAKSSVLYAVMEPTGGGPVLGALRLIAGKPVIFSYGTVETDKGLAVQNAKGQMGAVTSYGFLKDQVPEPFKKEWNGGNGMHIHHKFIVIDFNGDKPIVYAGSSNLASGGEMANGDNLARIADPFIAGMYAIEAVRLFDHYAFRKYMAKATKAKPLSLWYPGKPGGDPAWWKVYYDKQDIKFRDRYLFAGLPLPADVAPVKDADWSSLDNGGKSGKPAAAKRTAKSAKKKAPSKRKKPATKSKAKRKPAKRKAKTTRAKSTKRKKKAAPRKRKAAPRKKKRATKRRT